MKASDRIIFYPHLSVYGGEERNMLSFCAYLHGKRISHRLVCYENGMNFASYGRSPIKVENLRAPSNPFIRSWLLAQRLRTAGRDGAGRVYLGGIQSATHAGLFSPGGYVLRISDTPSLLGESPSSALSVLRQWSTRSGFRKAKSVVTSTRYLAKEIFELYGVHSEILPVGGNLDNLVFKERPLSEGEPVRLLSVSRIEENKRIDWMLKIIQLIGEHPTACYLDIVGDGSLRNSMVTMVRELGLTDRVKFHGFVNDEELGQIFSRAHIFLMPARQGFGMPAVEALARGIPVVVHRESGISESLEETPWAELFEGEVEPFLLAVRTMIERIRRGPLSKRTLPALPTEENWGRTIAGLLGWLAESS